MRCDPDLGEVFCAIRHIPCAVTGYVDQLSNPWLHDRYKTLQPCYAIKPKTCKYSYILRGYNKWFICQIDLKKSQKRWILNTRLY